MTTYTVADRNYPYKHTFIDAVKSGRNVTLFGMTPAGSFTSSLRELHDRAGHAFTVTNNSRSWFAECTVKPGRRIGVK